MPRKSEDTLYQLIQSMTKAEKSYFRKQSRAFSEKDTAYLELFDALVSLKKYDEKALRAALSGKRFLKQLPVMKHYLYEELLDSLVRFRAKDDTEIQLYQTRQAIAVLMQKKLPIPAERLLKKALKKAVEEERFLIVLHLLGLQNKLYVNFKNESWQAQKKTWEDMDRYLNKFQNLQIYQRLHASVLRFLKRERIARSASDKEELEQLIQNPYLQDIGLAESFWALVFREATFDAYHKAQGDFEGAFRHVQMLLNRYEEQPHWQKIDVQNYMGVIINYLNTAYYTQKTELLLEGISKLQKLNFKDFKLEMLREMRSMVLHFSYMKLSGDFSEFKNLCSVADGYVAKNQSKLPTGEKRLLYYNILHNALRIGDIDAAFDRRLQLAQLPRTQTQSDFQRFERLLEILIHYEKGNEELVLSLCQNIKRQLSESGYESLFVQMFQKIVKTPLLERKTLWTDWIGEWKKLFEHQPEEVKALEYFDVMLWLQAKQAGCTMNDLQKR